MRTIPSPLNYYSVLRLINKNKSPFHDRYYIVLNQVEICKELDMNFVTINTIYRDYKKNGIILKEGMNYYLTQKGLKVVTMYEQTGLDFICYYKLLESLCKDIAFYREKMLIVADVKDLQTGSELKAKELNTYMNYLIDNGLVEIKEDRKYITPKAVEEFLFFKQNYFTV